MPGLLRPVEMKLLAPADLPAVRDAIGVHGDQVRGREVGAPF